MSKLNMFEKEAFELNADIFREENVTVVSIKDLGLTIGLRSTNERMTSHVRVYITQCSPNEKFKFKRGVNELMNKYHNDNYIVIPVEDSITDTLGPIIALYFKYVSIYDVECRYHFDSINRSPLSK